MRTSTFAGAIQMWAIPTANTTQASPINRRSHAAGAAGRRRGNAQEFDVIKRRAGFQTWEKDGIIPSVHGIFYDRGRLLVAINFNCDLGDAWEWAEDPYYPLEFSTYAYQMGVNMIVYAMSH